MDISFVIVAWNNRDELKQCLNALNRQSPLPAETIVVDNNSNDGTVEMIESEYPDVVLLRLPENLGFAEGCNRGIEIARGEWVCTLNSDATLEPDWMTTITTAISTLDAKVGMLQPKVLFRKDPKRVNSKGIVLLATGSSGDRGFNSTDDADESTEEIFVPSACTALYRKTMLEQTRLETGYFDRTFFMYVEDLDLGWRCRLAGWRALYVPEARVLHTYQSSAKQIGSDFAEMQCRVNRLRALFKNASVTLIVMSIPKTFYDLLKGLRKSGIEIFAEFLRAAKDGLSQRKGVTRVSKISRRVLEKEWVTWALRVENA